VAEDKHSGRVRAQKDRSHKQLEILECLAFRSIIGIKLDDYEISIVREMVSTAEGKILGVGFPNGTIGELRGGVGEERIPPIEETRGIAVWRDWVVPCTMTRRDRTANNTDGDRLAKESFMYDLLNSSAAA
jgi:hypothetical protein